jgi:hypothetical protein
MWVSPKVFSFGSGRSGLSFLVPRTGLSSIIDSADLSSMHGTGRPRRTSTVGLDLKIPREA